MYLSLTLALGNMIAITPPLIPDSQMVIEQNLDTINDRSSELKMAQQPTPTTPVLSTTKELTFQEEIDKKYP